MPPMRPTRTRSARTRKEDLMVLCARIGYNPPA
jgi:hypothetical protein